MLKVEGKGPIDPTPSPLMPLCNFFRLMPSGVKLTIGQGKNDKLIFIGKPSPALLILGWISASIGYIFVTFSNEQRF